MPKYRVICTHNPQDFFNGIEPTELSFISETDQLEETVDEKLNGGYQVIVTRGCVDSCGKHKKADG